MEQFHSMAAVAKRTHIFPDTIRSWERRYKLIEPRREASGVRLYSEADITRLELARDATRLGHAIRHVAAMSNREIQALLKSESQAAAQSTPAYEIVIGSAVQLMHAFDFLGVQRTLSTAALTLPHGEFALSVLAPFLRAIGEEWSSGKLSIAQEHAASQIVRNLVGTLMLQAPAATRGAVVFATPPSEQHEFGVAIGALVAAGYGLNATILGALPAREIANAAIRLDARTVVIGSMANASDPDVTEFLAALTAALKGRASIWLGGAAAATRCENLQHVRAISTLDELASHLKAVSADWETHA